MFSGFVFYEGDCYMGLKNPYIPLNVEDPSLAQKLQKNLFGDGLQVIIHLILINLFIQIVPP